MQPHAPAQRLEQRRKIRVLRWLYASLEASAKRYQRRGMAPLGLNSAEIDARTLEAQYLAQQRQQHAVQVWALLQVAIAATITKIEIPRAPQRVLPAIRHPLAARTATPNAPN